MNDEKVKLSVEIYGETYNMKMTEDQEKMIKIVGLVDTMMHEVGDKQPMLHYKDVAVLAALNLSERYFKLQEDYQVLLDLIEEEQ